MLQVEPGLILREDRKRRLNTLFGPQASLREEARVSFRNLVASTADCSEVGGWRNRWGLPMPDGSRGGWMSDGIRPVRAAYDEDGKQSGRTFCDNVPPTSCEIPLPSSTADGHLRRPCHHTGDHS